MTCSTALTQLHNQPCMPNPPALRNPDLRMDDGADRLAAGVVRIQRRQRNPQLQLALDFPT